MRALKIATAVMGVLIVAGTVLLVTLVVRRSAGPGAVAASVLLDEPAGTRIEGVSLLADRLAVQLGGGGPDRVLLLDLQSGRVVGRVGLAR